MFNVFAGNPHWEDLIDGNLGILHSVEEKEWFAPQMFCKLTLFWICSDFLFDKTASKVTSIRAGV